jgi:serine/threonine protein phosphatase PrpC
MGDLQVTATVLTHNGGQRSANEDSVVVGACTFTSVSSSQPHTVVLPAPPGQPVVVAVADGLGGHEAGEVASAHVGHHLASVDRTMLLDPAAIGAMLKAIPGELAAIANGHSGRQDMGTTVVGLSLSPEQAVWFNIGDSRAYRLSGGYLGQLSVDDTPTAFLAEAGESPDPTNVVTQSIGPSSAPLSPHAGIEAISDDGAYLLCSDGLSDLVEVAEMERILAERADDDDTAVKALWAAAMNAGGRDNITVVLVRARQLSPVPMVAEAEPVAADAPPATELPEGVPPGM